MPRAPLKCDFCGCEAPRVRRVALDRDYDRLAQRHALRYACDACSARKDAERLRAPGTPDGTPVDGSSRPL